MNDLQPYEAPSLDSAEILMVDDEPRNLQLLGSLLFQHGYNLTLAGNGAQALDAARNSPPDLILMDVMMPVMDGFEVTRRLKQEVGLSDVPVIFLTAKSESDDIRTGFRAGGVDYVVKPFQAEELLLRIQTHLELKRTRERLAEANANLMKQNSEKSQFISMIAHDLRNPFHALRMFPDFILNYHESAERSMIENLARESIHEIDRVSSFLEELMEWALMQMNLLEVRRESFKLADLVKEVCDQAGAQARRKGITLLHALPDEITVYADRKMIGTVVRNLVSNGIKFTHRNGQVEVSAREPEGGGVLLEVIDNGVGMQPELQQKLFSLDERVTMLGTEREKGSGLGLILCQQFLARHGSNFCIHSVPAEGTTFSFQLPRPPTLLVPAASASAQEGGK